MQNTLQDESNSQMDRLMIKKGPALPSHEARGFNRHSRGSLQVTPPSQRGEPRKKPDHLNLNKDLQNVWNLDKLSFSDQPPPHRRHHPPPPDVQQVNE